ncbi:MAG: hypothetical protein M1829_001962 [Trizodia sp. TS-e1964]|nr:MAG: hypothetical protein M1829_001962 [Trizodia sp. TS-e1964]
MASIALPYRPLVRVDTHGSTPPSGSSASNSPYPSNNAETYIEDTAESEKDEDANGNRAFIVGPTIVDAEDSDGEDETPLAAEVDIFTLSPIAALKMLCSSIEALVLLTGDVPPTPPVSHPTTPNLKAIQAEKDDLARHDAGILEKSSSKAASSPLPHTLLKYSSSEGLHDDENEDPSPLHDSHEAPSSPASSSPPPSPASSIISQSNVIGADTEPISIQHACISRKFYSKRPPPIPLLDYILRIHRYCPMSTGVYLAASLYIHRLAVIERVIAVTRRSAHRLLLASLRVAMKALEDLSYPHKRFAKVGGVTEVELARLEINFCFLTSFELRVDEPALVGQVAEMRAEREMLGRRSIAPRRFERVRRASRHDESFVGD